MRLDQQIHRQIYRAARNAFLEATLEQYFNLSLRLWYLVLDRLPWREAVAAATDGRIVDAKSIVGLLWLARLRETGAASSG